MKKIIILIGFVSILFVSPKIYAANVFTYVVNSESNTVSVIDAMDHAIKTTIHNIGSSPWKLIAHPSGSNIYITNSTATTVSVIDTSTNKVTTNPIAVGRQPKEIAISPDGKFLYVVNAVDNNISVIDTKTNSPVAGSPLTAGKMISDVALSPDGKFVYIVNGGDNTVSVLDASTKTAIMGSPLTVGNHPIAVVVSADSSQAFVANLFDSTVSVINASTASIPPKVSAGPSVNLGSGLLLDIILNPTSKEGYVLNAGDGMNNGTVSILDTSKNPPVVKGAPIPVGKASLGISVTPDGKTVYVANNGDNTVSIIDVTKTPPIVSSKTVGNSPTSLITLNIPPAAAPPGDPNGTQVPPGGKSGGSDEVKTGATVPANVESGSGGCSFVSIASRSNLNSFVYLFSIFLPLGFYRKPRKK